MSKDNIILKMDEKILGEQLQDSDFASKIHEAIGLLFSERGLCADRARELLSNLAGVVSILNEELSRIDSDVCESENHHDQFRYKENDFVDDSDAGASGEIRYCKEDWEIAKGLNDIAEGMYNDVSEDDKARFCMDGIYPGYSKARFKILFVAREAYCMDGENYMRVVGESLKNGRFGEWTINQYPFHRRQFYIAWGIANNFPDWKDVPWATEISEKIKFGTPSCNLGWAFMNLCKISNKTGSWETDYETYRKFVKDQGENLKKEIEIIKPHLIIGSGVYDLVELLGYKNVDKENNNCFYWSDGINGVPPMLDCYHFSAIKSDQKCYYEAVRDVLCNHRESFGNNAPWTCGGK